LLVGGVAQGRLASTGNTRVKVDTLAAYAYDTVALSERWSVTGGLRAEHYKVDIKATDPAGTRLDGSETTLGGKLGLVYKPARNGSIYASFSSSS
ncbi:TonB-dependent receptor, partial [Acinetobacter baumannii]